MLPDRNGVDALTVAGYFSHGITAVGGDTMSESLFPIPYGDNPLRVPIPGQVIDPAVDDRVFTLSYALSDTVPHSHYSRGVATRNVETRGGKPCNCSLGFVFCVLGRNGGVIDGAKKDGFV